MNEKPDIKWLHTFQIWYSGRICLKIREQINKYTEKEILLRKEEHLIKQEAN